MPSGTVCIPGGAFFLGALVTGSPITVSIPEHLVQVSPFAIDVEEMTVATVRGLVRSGAVTIQPRQVDRDPRTVDHACTWSGAANASTDALPVTCISRDGAAAVCAALGKRLPTEAEYEWAAGNLSLETDFAWGGDPDACSNGIIGRGRSLLEGPPMNGESPACRTVGSTTGLLPWGPVAGGSPRDVTQLGVKNLSGNVAELVSDGSLSYSDSCWGPSTTLLVDPHCDSPTAQALSRGGSWDRFELGARVTFREPRPREGSPTVGFRCVKAM